MSYRDTSFRSAHTSVRSTLSSLRSRAFADCDQVYPGLYVGDAISAKDKNFLREMRINYVLNTAEGKHSTQVDTSQFYYRDCPNIKYKGFPMMDMPYTNISKYFYIAADFIDEAISGGGRVLVHCMAGVSRSATCAIAYLMIKKDMSFAEAMATISNRRSIHPNEGFIRQLQELDRELRSLRSYRLERFSRPLYTRSDPYAY